MRSSGTDGTGTASAVSAMSAIPTFGRTSSVLSTGGFSCQHGTSWTQTQRERSVKHEANPVYERSIQVTVRLALVIRTSGGAGPLRFSLHTRRTKPRSTTSDAGCLRRRLTRRATTRRQARRRFDRPRPSSNWRVESRRLTELLPITRVSAGPSADLDSRR